MPNSASGSVALQVEGLRKSFGTNMALSGVSFSLAANERLALLGPNGAGKTTLIRCLCGRTGYDAGTIEWFGKQIPIAEACKRLGWVPQEIALYADLTTRENLWAFARFHGVARKEIRQRVQWALQWTGLENRASERVGRFSGGMKRRINIACSVLHRPRILLLDEPTVGVDPQSRQRIFTMLDELHQQGTAIVLTTHHLDEAEQRSDRIVIMDHGCVIAEGTIDQLVNQTVGRSRWVRLRVNKASSANAVFDVGAVDCPLPAGPAASSAGPFEATFCGTEVTARIDNVAIQLPKLLDHVHQAGLEVLDVEVNAPSLHHVFLHLTGQQLRDE